MNELRVRYSALGLRSLHPRNPERKGIIIPWAHEQRNQKSSIVKVKWDGLKQISTIHIGFIEPDIDTTSLMEHLKASEIF